MRRRYKRIQLSNRLMVSIFNTWADPNSCLQYPASGKLPEGVRIVNVTNNFPRQCLEAVLYHDSFPVVPEGECIPLFGESNEFFDTYDFKTIMIEDLFRQKGYKLVEIEE